MIWGRKQQLSSVRGKSHPPCHKNLLPHKTPLKQQGLFSVLQQVDNWKLLTWALHSERRASLRKFLPTFSLSLSDVHVLWVCTHCACRCTWRPPVDVEWRSILRPSCLHHRWFTMVTHNYLHLQPQWVWYPLQAPAFVCTYTHTHTKEP